MYLSIDLERCKPLGHMVICLAFISFHYFVTHVVDSGCTIYECILHVSPFVYQTLINESLSFHLCCYLLVVMRWVYCVYFEALQCYKFLGTNLCKKLMHFFVNLHIFVKSVACLMKTYAFCVILNFCEQTYTFLCSVTHFCEIIYVICEILRIIMF